MTDKPQQSNLPERARGSLNLAMFLGRIVGGFVGLCLGVTIGIQIGGSLSPVLGGVIGLFAGAFISQLIFKSFPRLSSNRTISARSASYSIIGLFAGLMIGDALGTFTNFDRLYSGFIGASLGLYAGMLLGLAHRRKGK
ncbi:MAG TPA: hypothetical protein VGC91_12265 [Pyrinomonadaceae bacterium]|jgi:uncharacterized membrane protein